MPNIKEMLQNILTAVYGKDVRQSIHDAIQQCYNEVGYYKPSMNASGLLLWTPSQDSLPAAPSVSIKGPTGDPGKTPVKGVDYYTEEEKTEFIKALGEAFKVTWAIEEVIDTYHYSGGGSPDNGHFNDAVSYGGPGWYKIGTSVVYLDGVNDHNPHGYHYSEDGSRWSFEGPEDVYLVDENGDQIEDEEDKYSITLSKVIPYSITDGVLPGSGAVVEFSKTYSTDDYNDNGYIFDLFDPESHIKDLKALTPGYKYKLGDFEFVATDDTVGDFFNMASEFGDITSEDDNSTWYVDSDGLYCSSGEGVITLCCVGAAPSGALPDYLGTGYGFLKRYSIKSEYDEDMGILNVYDSDCDLKSLTPGRRYKLGDFEFVASANIVGEMQHIFYEVGTITSEDDGSTWEFDEGWYCSDDEGVISLCCVEADPSGVPVPTGAKLTIKPDESWGSNAVEPAFSKRPAVFFDDDFNVELLNANGVALSTRIYEYVPYIPSVGTCVWDISNYSKIRITPSDGGDRVFSVYADGDYLTDMNSVTIDIKGNTDVVVTYGPR